MARYNDAYLRRVCRSVGVPPMWRDDCAQELRLAAWLEGANFSPRRRAIDFVRIHGERTRGGVDRDERPYPEDRGAAQYETAEAFHSRSNVERDMLLDAELDAVVVAIATLTAHQRRALTRHLAGLPSVDNTEEAHRYQARLKLRRLLRCPGCQLTCPPTACIVDAR